MKHYPLLISQATKPDGHIDVLSPYDQTAIASVDYANSAQIEQALETAYSIFRDRSKWLSVKQRVDILDSAASKIHSRLDSLALEAAREGGKPLNDSVVELNRAVDGLKIAIESIRTDAGHVIPMGGDAYSANRSAFTCKEPIGVVVAVSAFNHPFNLIVHQVAAAVAAGCPVIVKPAETTPISCMNFVSILHECGLPVEYCQAVITNDLAVAEQLVTDRRVGFFSFIGSSKVGWMLNSKLTPGARSALEHGGAAPALVYSDADIDAALPLLAKGGFYHAGQVCVSVQRVFADQSIAQSLANKIAEMGNTMVVGDPTSAATEVGPLILPREVDRVHQWVGEAVVEGAQLLSGGQKISDSCYQPTVLFNPSATSKVSKLEIFGPVICVYSCDNMDKAINQANSLNVAFQAAVFTKDIDTALHAYRHLDASAVMLNDHSAFRVDGMPFAGLRESGLGVGGIPYTIEDMQIEKMLVIKSVSL